MTNKYTQQTEKLKELFQETMSRLLDLRKEQNDAVADFYKKLEAKKIENIKKKLGVE